MRRKLILLTMIALLVLSCPVTAFAREFDSTKSGSITITLLEQDGKQPIVGTQFDVYYLATAGVNAAGKLYYAYTDPFLECDIPLDDPKLPEKLSEFVQKNEITGTHIVTDEKGIASCSQLPLGLYLVRQSQSVEGFRTCTPFLVTVPLQKDADFVYDVNASPKTDIVRLVSITVKKVWNTDTSTQIPSSVTVDLYRDEEVIETVKLNKDNNWQVTFEDMPQSDTYKIEETDIPKGFTATYAEKDFVFTVTNTASLAQTGQLVWPIPVLGAMGLLFILLGFLILRKPEKTNA